VAYFFGPPCIGPTRGTKNQKLRNTGCSVAYIPQLVTRRHSRCKKVNRRNSHF